MPIFAKEQLNAAMPISGAWPRWAAFGVISLAAHSLLLFGNNESPFVFPDAAPGMQIISVSLAPLHAQPAASNAHAEQTKHAASPAPNRPAEKIAPQKPPTLASNASLRLISESEPEAASKIVGQVTATVAPIENDTKVAQHEATPQTNTTTQPSESPEQQQQAQRNFLLGKVRSLLTKHFSYPLRARQRGWEGEVLLGFRVDENGRLGNVHLARSSGYSVLDHSALAALTQVKDIPLFDSNPLGPMELQLPVLYQLREG